MQRRYVEMMSFSCRVRRVSEDSSLILVATSLTAEISPGSIGGEVADKEVKGKG